ncbi:MAG TPA: proline iminopeptidase-family hydrolase [Acidimicrobiales bacterium]|nr:proline iminopeptidase-family hydrolase [Acidimicrobiales bacterium]
MSEIPEPSRTGTVTFGPYETWYRVTGEIGGGPTPLVVLHGGPGACHDYTLRIARVAETGRAVVHYDQVGCGRSTHRPDAPIDFWNVDLFLDELDNLLGALGIGDDYHVLGQSWGGMLGAEHAVRAPAGLRSIVISNSPASMPLWLEGANRLRAELPEPVRAALDRHEAAGTLEDPEYLDATDEYYARHVCRVVPNPPEVLSSKALINEDPTVYTTMNGPNEFYCVGTLKDWTVIDRLAGVVAPTLLVSGRYDEATPEAVRPFFEHIPDVRWEVLAESSHMPFIEETDEYLRIVSSFLGEHDG